MPDVSRRQFLRNASIGAATAGVLAVTGTGVLSVVETAGSSTESLSASQSESDLEASDVFARVVDAKSGHIKIYVGTKAVDYTNRALAQQLLRAAR